MISTELNRVSESMSSIEALSLASIEDKELTDCLFGLEWGVFLTMF